uniref:Uncharacterized protein n=1 Tax=Acrobeloides nanus TaxID=290746 RepID=A0A914E0T3_9BILA
MQKVFCKIGTKAYSMVNINGILMSNSRLDLSTLGFFTHGYKTRTTTNFYTHIVPIIAEHGKETITTPAGDTSNCKIEDEQCNLTPCDNVFTKIAITSDNNDSDFCDNVITYHIITRYHMM